MEIALRTSQYVVQVLRTTIPKKVQNLHHLIESPEKIPHLNLKRKLIHLHGLGYIQPRLIPSSMISHFAEITSKLCPVSSLKTG